MSAEGEGGKANRGEKDRLLRKIIMAFNSYGEMHDIAGNEAMIKRL